MIVTINVRDARSDVWTRFWVATTDNVPVQRFGFRMSVMDCRRDIDKIRKRCIEQMRWAKQIMRDEERTMRRMSYQTMSDCRSHRAMVNARNSLILREKMIRDVVDALRI